MRWLTRARFVETLTSPRGSEGEIAWSTAAADGDSVLLYLGLRYPTGVLKTRWSLARRGGAEWRIGDVLVSDPGISLAAEAGRSFGSGEVRRRDRARDAWREAFPRLLGIGAIVAIVVFVRRRLTPAGRKILQLTAAAPAILFAVDGFLTVRRVLSEPWVVAEDPEPSPWRHAERQAVAAQREGRLDEARRHWQEAIAAGAAPAPAEYQLGLALKAAGRVVEAKEAFARALAGSPSAPGAAKELGLLLLAEGEPGEARERLRAYLSETGPDPDALSALGVAEANVGEGDAAVRSVEEAQTLMAERWKGLRLQSQIYARAGEARKAVEALRALESGGTVDRESLRSDPAYLPIATDPAWVSFLSETPVPAPTPGR